MGTSKRYGGSKNGLVPSWVDDNTSITGPVQELPQMPNTPAGGGTPGPTPTPPPSRLPPPPPSGSTATDYAQARAAFTRFSRTRDRRDLGRALSHYTGDGAGGRSRSASRLGASRAAGSRLLGIVRDLQRVGAAEVLRQLNLDGMAGQPADRVFLAMLEYVCPAGGTLDEGIARQAMLEAIGDLAEAGTTSFDTMTIEERCGLFIEFVIHSIEGQVLAELFQRGIAMPASSADIEYVQDQLHDFVGGCIRGSLEGRLSGVDQMSNGEIDRTVRAVYEGAFGLVQAAAAQEVGE